MKRGTFAALLLMLAAAPAVWGQSGGIFEITRSTLDGGGSTERTSGDVLVRGTIGQPDVASSGFGVYYLTGGFWSTQGRLGIFFLDGFESGDTSAWSLSVGEASSPVPGSAASVAEPVPASGEPTEPDAREPSTFHPPTPRESIRRN